MPKSQFKWTVGGPLPAIEPHSDAKLKLLELYLQRYFAVVAGKPQMDKLSISFVDGFSGGGAYRGKQGEERSGSPFVLLKSVREAEATLNLGRHKPLEINAKFYFVEIDKGAVEHLIARIKASEFAAWLSDGRIVVQHGEFEQAFPAILSDIQNRQRGGRSVFLLDQKGWSDVQFATIRRILGELPASEVLLTFAVDWLISYLNTGAEFEQPMLRAGFNRATILRYCEAKGNPGFRYVIPRLLKRDIQVLTGAPYFTPFFLRSGRANRDLWIIHLSKLTKARNVMVESHWDVSNAANTGSIHQGASGLDMLGFDPHWEEGLPLDFAFDEMADQSIQSALLRDLPEAVHSFGDAVPTVDALISRLANNTAATEQHIQAALKSLHHAHEVEIVTPNGARKRGGGAMTKADRVQIPRQRWLGPV